MHVQVLLDNKNLLDMQDVHAIFDVHVLQPSGQLTHFDPESLYPAGHVVTF